MFGPVYSHVVLRLRPGYVPKVRTTPFRDQVVNLQALPSEEADPALVLLCPVRALRIYLDRTQCVRSSKQLFVCHGGQQKEKAVSKQRLAHWIVEAVALVYQSQGEPCPLGVRAHSTMRWRTAPLWQTSAELRAGRHRTPSSKHPRQSDWVEQSDTRPNTGASSPGSPVSPCTGLGVRMA